MNLLNLILENGGDAIISQMAKKVGLPENQASQVLSMLVPALGQGLKRNLNDPSQLGNLVNKMAQGNVQEVLDKPEVLAQDETIQEGNSILGQLFGSKDVSRAVASQVAEKAGTDPSIIKQLLPMVATLAMGALGKEGQKRGAINPNNPTAVVEETSITATFMEFLDMDDDGSVVDDIFNIARKFL
ncbi:MAG: hypothetical protein AXA67_11860 [Methylothermaceae bacteria B42]|nr:MAG: hypothetical protein AXA67_11860 [Methylothermaceae bacteria B42]HHJ39226.1 DUF937 domain-containing protein [Methylothermaceae bacterium]